MGLCKKVSLYAAMAEVEPMKIDGADGMKRTLDCPDKKNKPLKRKRLDPSLYAGTPEEKEAIINTFRNEISSLVKFYGDLSLENRGALLENVERVGNSASLNCVIACLMEESDHPLSKLVDEIFEKVRGRVGNGEGVTRAGVESTVLTSADADLLGDEARCAL